MFNKETLLNTINADAKKQSDDKKRQYTEKATAMENAFVNLQKRKDEIKDICQVAHAFLTKDRSKNLVHHNRVFFKLGCCGRNGYGVDGICPISYSDGDHEVCYFPDGMIKVGKGVVPLMNAEDVTPKLKEISEGLKQCKNDSIARLGDNDWVSAWTIAEGLIAINKHLDALKDELVKAVNHEDEKDKVIWEVDGERVMMPRLTDDERKCVDQFVHKVPPVGDACAPIFNLLIRFARETLDSEAK